MRIEEQEEQRHSPRIVTDSHGLKSKKSNGIRHGLSRIDAD
jgi:hypothetical protein